MLIVFGPLIVFVSIAEEEPIDSWGEWLLGVVAILVPVLLVRRFWPWLTREETTPPLTTEQALQKRIVEIADNVDALPGGVELHELWKSLDERELRRVLHLMNTTRPGNRYLRDALMRLHE